MNDDIITRYYCDEPHSTGMRMYHYCDEIIYPKHLKDQEIEIRDPQTKEYKSTPKI